MHPEQQINDRVLLLLIEAREALVVLHKEATHKMLTRTGESSKDYRETRDKIEDMIIVLDSRYNAHNKGDS